VKNQNIHKNTGKKTMKIKIALNTITLVSYRLRALKNLFRPYLL